jgi:nickel-dependent lactate racemase
MTQINLAYGKSEIPFLFDAARFEILGRAQDAEALSDAEIGERFDRPVGAKPLEEIINPNETVLIVVPDATRRTASAQTVNLLIRRLIANGTRPFEINIIFATGIHRPVTDDEKRALVTPFIFQRIKTLDHNARDLMQMAGLESKQFASFGQITGDIPVELNRVLTEFDHIILVGGITFHYFAGFTGSRKLVCPGLASERTISETHKLAFDCQTKQRRAGVGTGLLDKNAVHEAFTEAAAKVKPSFSINTIVNRKGEAAEIFCGDWREAHRAACDFYATRHTIEIPEKRDLVIASCGGAPHDINMIQAHKALEMASLACREGGTIALLAECPDGLGRSDFPDWFAAENSGKLAENLCENYQVNGQTAWSLLKKAERFDVHILTSLAEEETRLMRLRKARSLEEIMSEIDSIKKGYILPFGAKFLIKN